MRINGERGQRIQLRYADSLKGGDLDIAGVWFVRDNWDRDKDIVHKDTYICKGVGDEVYTPAFTYHGFRYVKVLGISEEQATKEGISYKVCKLPMTYAGRFVAENEGQTGLCKVIVAEDNRIIGMHLLGNPSSEFIGTACLAISHGITVEQLQRTVFPHPTVSEIIKESLFEL
jgi:hypothetical protein